MRIALDTNVLVYAEKAQRLPTDAHRVVAARTLVARIPTGDLIVPLQVLGELYNVLTRRHGRTAVAAAAAVDIWRTTFAVQETSSAAMAEAIELAARHRLQVWDAVILIAAAEAGCLLLLSEDMQDGFTWRGVTVVNPFAATPHPLLLPYIPPM